MSSRRFTVQCLRASTEKDSTTGGSAALRDFDPAYVRFGSGATDALKAARPSMSALPRKRPLWHEHSIRRFVPGPDIYLVIIYPRCRRESVRPWGGSK